MAKELVYLLDGLSRDELLIKELLPGSIQLEDRDTSDLLKLISDLSRYLVYFNDGNRPEGNWEEFFKTDFNILNNLITKFDLQGYLNHFYLLETKLERAVSDSDVLDALKKIFYFIFAAGVKMYELTKMLLAVQKTPFFTLKLEEILQKLKNSIAHLRAYNDQAANAFNILFIEDNAFEKEGFELKINIDNIFGKDGGVSERAANAFITIKNEFDQLRKGFNRVLNACIYYVGENPVTEQNYRPHLALIITFLELYGHLKTDINKLPEKHLEFYYQKILGFERLPAVPDKVNLLFEPLPDTKQVVLKKGELVSGNIPSIKDSIIYQLDQDILLSKAHIASLKTLFSIHNNRITPKKESNKIISELQLYKAEYNNPEPKYIIKNADKTPFWPMLGQDVNELSPAQRRNSITDTGLLVASPVLYQQYGARKIQLKFLISEDSFNALKNYINNYQGFSNRSKVQYTLLEHAFVIDFTGPTGWEKARYTNIELNRNDKSLDVELQQDSSNAPFVNYSALHGQLTGIQWPAIRLLINNQANFNPLVYLQYLHIERITIHVKVTNVTNYTLQNNIGSLSNTNDFQPFGPLSPAGSYFDIINANIFNRFLISVALRMEWASLPDTTGGFETHYQQYGNNIKNSSFRLRLLSMKNANTGTSVIKNEFPMFETDFDNNFEQILKKNTSFKKEEIDIRELGYTNNPVLEKEVQPMPGEIIDGTLRIEFCSPKFGFGHEAFLGVFSNAALHNSRRWVKKTPFPLKPYTPLLNNIVIDFNQSASERLDSAEGNNPALSSITFIHLQPFGQEQIFPGTIKSIYPLIPREDYDNNFYIGFDKITPGEEISILFHLEEKSFHESAVKLQPLHWSYLYHNSWINMNEKHLLSDQTENLITSGTVKLIIPQDIHLGNTTMPGDLYWIRVSSRGKNAIRSKIKALYLNAVTATRVIEYDSPSFLELPSGVLKSFINPVKGIQNIWQLFPSFEGRPAENDVEFYIRVSQRLRHKNRLLMSKDIEMAVLQNFPEIYIAKCIRPDEKRSKAFANFSMLKIVLVALSESTGSKTPMVSLDTLCKVKDFLQPRLSPLLDIIVENPEYERVKVVCKVKFVSENESERLLYTKLLENDINEFISPWYFHNDVNYRIGRKLFVSEMQNFIKEKYYISDIKSFGLAHFYNYYSYEEEEILSNMKDSNVITEGYLEGTTPEAIFIPAENHFIDMLGPEQQKEDEILETIGLDYLTVGEELFIGESSISEKTDPKKETRENKQYYNWVISKNK